jgi:hypothetical protein
MAGISTHFIAECKEELEFKKKEREQLLDQLALYDVRIDRYDAVIENMDRSLLPAISEINAGAAAAAQTYEARVTAGCKSDLAWVQTGVTKIGLPSNYGFGVQETQITYEVKKNSATYRQYGKWGIKYYRRPKNQDYGSNIVSEFYGAIGAGSTNLAIVQTGIAGTSGILVGDLITDDLENPSVFGIDDLPDIVGFGQSTLVIETKIFRGQVTIGSTVIAQAGAGDTNQIQVGNRIIGTSVLPFETTVVAISSTPVSIEIWDFDFGGFITTTVSAPSLVISQPALDTTTIDFAIGITSTYPSFFLSTSADNDVAPSDPTNFTVIRTTQSVLDEFDATNNPIDPVTVGIMNASTVGYGHSVVRVSSTAPPGPFQWREVLGEYDPEPACGAGFEDWYEGTTQWPILITNNFDSEGVLISSSSTHAAEGTAITISTGSTLPQKYGIGYTATSSNNPTFSGCGARDTAISNAEATRDASIGQSQSTVDETLAASLRLRQLRDNLEGQAFVFLQGRAAADAEIVRLTKAVAELEAVDLSQYEPKTNITKNKYTSSTVGVPTS